MPFSRTDAKLGGMKKPRSDSSPIVKTTIALPRPLWLTARTKALEQDRDFRDLVIDALELYLRQKKGVTKQHE